MTSQDSQTSQSKQKLFALIAVAIAFLGIAFSIAWFLPGGMDWVNTYRPATLNILAFRSPYTTQLFHSPPWTVLPLIPLALLPERVGYGLNFCLGTLATGYVAFRLGAKPLTIIAIILSYPVVFSNIYGNVDWLVYLGLLLPPRWGLFFVLTKPQAGIGLVVFWLIEGYREGGIKKVLGHFAPVTLVLLLSFIIWGLWPTAGFTEIGKAFNASLWPQSLPIGIALLIYAIRTHRPGLALAASPFLAPYVTPGSWGASILGLLPLDLETIAAVISIWILRIYTGYFLNQ